MPRAAVFASSIFDMAGREHILLAEEDEDYACILQLAFQKAAVLNPVDLAGSPKEAVAYLAGTGVFANRSVYPLPRLVMLGLRLPLLNGFELLRWIRRRSELRHTRIVVLSGSEFPGESKVAQDLGADLYRVKPFQFEELVRLVEWIRQEWLEPSPERQLAA